jgi:hypothetical protein
MLAVGGWDGRVILLESVGWSVESVIEPIRTAGAGMVRPVSEIRLPLRAQHEERC